MAVNPISGADDDEDGDNGNEKIESDCYWEGQVLHSGEGPGHGLRGERPVLSYRFEGLPMGSPMMFPMASLLKSSQVG